MENIAEVREALIKEIPNEISVRIPIKALFSNRNEKGNCVGAQTLKKALRKAGIDFNNVCWGTHSGNFCSDGYTYVVSSHDKEGKRIDMMGQYLPKVVTFEIRKY